MSIDSTARSDKYDGHASATRAAADAVILVALNGARDSGFRRSRWNTSIGCVLSPCWRRSRALAHPSHMAIGAPAAVPPAGTVCRN